MEMASPLENVFLHFRCASVMRAKNAVHKMVIHNKTANKVNSYLKVRLNYPKQ